MSVCEREGDRDGVREREKEMNREREREREGGCFVDLPGGGKNDVKKANLYLLLDRYP